MLNEKGAVYPLVLVIAIVAFFILFEVTMMYMSELSFLKELQNYYKGGIKEMLIRE